MLSAQEHDDIVSQFYASATGERPWAATLERAASAFGSSATLLGIHRHDSMAVLAMESHNYSKEFIADFFGGEIYANDPRIPYLERVPEGGIYYDEALYDVREIERDPWVRASIDTLKVFDQIGAKMRLPGEGVATLGILRTQREGRITRDGVESFRRLVPQLERACALGYVVEQADATRTVLLDALARKADGLIILDARGAVVFMNDTATRFLQSDDGLTIQDSAFAAKRPPETRRLQRMIKETVDSFRAPGQSAGGQMLVSRVSGRKPFAVRVMPSPARDSFLSGKSIACVIHVQDLAAPAPSKETLRVLFGLTNREADLAIEIVRCAGLEPAAAHCGMAVNTARNHLQSIFGKAGIASQAELVQLFGKIV